MPLQNIHSKWFTHKIFFTKGLRLKGDGRTSFTLPFKFSELEVTDFQSLFPSFCYGCGSLGLDM
jgi:hypothetical protein